MNPSNFILRVLLFVVAIPALFLAVLSVPEPNYPLFLLIVLGVGALSGPETARLFLYPDNRYRGSEFVIPILGMLVPLTVTFVLFEVFPVGALSTLISLIFAITLIIQLTRRGERTIPRIIPSVSGHIMVLLYPGVFLGYAVRLTTLPQAGALIVVFLAAVFLNDTMAYVTGMLFGKGSKGFVPVSPNKSLAGFAGGIVFSPLVILGAEALRPGLFPGHLATRILFGLLIGFAVIIGDLVESALKRSANVKDSGKLIPGRGGLLDSIDSPVFTAPFYYYLYLVLFL